MARRVDILPGQPAGYQTVREPASQPAQSFGPEPSEYGRKEPATGLAGNAYGSAHHYAPVYGNNALFKAIAAHEAAIQGSGQIASRRQPSTTAESKLTVAAPGSSGAGLDKRRRPQTRSPMAQQGPMAGGGY